MQQEKFSLISDQAILQDRDIALEGIPARTLQRAKKGDNITLETFVKILRSLGRLEELEKMLLTTDIRPVELIKNKKFKLRHRIRKQKELKNKKEWTWEE